MKTTNFKFYRVTSFFLICLFMISVSFGQETENKKGEHGIGFQIGGTTGHGLTYRYYGNKIGIQVSALPIFMPNDEFLMSAGLTGMYKIAESNRIDLVAYLGNHFVSRQPAKVIDENQPVNTVSSQPFQQELITTFLFGDSEIYNDLSYNMSVGLGGILHSKSRFVNFNFFTGYAVYSINKDPLSNLSLSIGITFKLN